MPLYSDRNFSILLPLNLMNRFMVSNVCIYWKFFSKTKTIGQKLYENVELKNLVAEKCPVNESVLVKFVKLASLLMHQDVSVFVWCVHPKISNTMLRERCARIRRFQDWNISRNSLRRILRKDLAIKS